MSHQYQIKVNIHNITEKMITLKTRDYIAQILYKKVTTPDIKTEVMFLNQIYHVQEQTILVTDTHMQEK